jgi:tetratricopeptide (TPR) repeat protein
MDKQLNWKEFLGWGEEQTSDLRNTGYAYLRQGKYNIAIPFFEALIALDSKNAYDLQTIGGLYLQVGDSLQALRYLDKALKQNPLHFPTLLNRAKALFILGYRDKAQRLAEKLHKHPDSDISDIAEALLLAYC